MKAKSNTSLTIGKVAKLAHVNLETVRFYEAKGLIEKPIKSGAFRYYSLDHIKKIKFVKKAQALGFTLAEAKSLLDLNLTKQAKCKDVLTKTQIKILEIEQKIADLKKMQASLRKLSKCCVDQEVLLSECPILDAFGATI